MQSLLHGTSVYYFAMEPLHATGGKGTDGGVVLWCALFWILSVEVKSLLQGVGLS